MKINTPIRFVSLQFHEEKPIPDNGIVVGNMRFLDDENKPIRSREEMRECMRYINQYFEKLLEGGNLL